MLYIVIEMGHWLILTSDLFLLTFFILLKNTPLVFNVFYETLKLVLYVPIIFNLFISIGNI